MLLACSTPVIELFKKNTAEFWWCMTQALAIERLQSCFLSSMIRLGVDGSLDSGSLVRQDGFDCIHCMGQGLVRRQSYT